MEISDKAVSLRIFLGEQDKYSGKPLYEVIVLKAREMHLAGATVFRSPLGFGHSSLLHTSKILRLSEDLPMVIEIIDSKEKIDNFLNEIKPMTSSGAGLLITLQNIDVLHYGIKK
jgi:uncharacterized protein